MPLEHLNPNPEITAETYRARPHLDLVDPTPTRPSCISRPDWDEELEQMRWADDGGGNLG